MSVCKKCRNDFTPKKLGQVYCCRECYVSVGTSKRCPRCKDDKPIDEFIDQKGKGRKSGYCASCRQIMERERSESLKGRFQFGVKRARYKRIGWSLSIDEFSVLISMPCHYCERVLDKTGVGLDRLRPEHGYEAGNVVPCCRRCNMVKGDNFDYDEMLRLAVVIRLLDVERANN